MTRVSSGAFCSPGTQIIAILSLILLTEISTSPITNPHRNDADISSVIPDYFDRKSFKAYHNSTPHDRKDVPIITYNSPDPDCNVGFKLAWSSTVGSPVYSSPVIFPSGRDGEKQILLSTFHQHVEILGHDGYKPSGWPLSFEDSTFQGSPMLYDIDGDGTNDVGVVDKDGNMFWIRIGDYGQYMEDYHIQVPKLKIKRDWAVGLDPKFTDNYVIMSMFDHKTDRNSRKYSYEGPPTTSIFAKEKGEKADKGEDSKVGKAALAKKIKADDLGVLPIRQDSYPELNKYNKDKTGKEGKGPESAPQGGGSRRLLSISEEDLVVEAEVEKVNETEAVKEEEKEEVKVDQVVEEVKDKEAFQKNVEETPPVINQDNKGSKVDNEGSAQRQIPFDETKEVAHIENNVVAESPVINNEVIDTNEKKIESNADSGLVNAEDTTELKGKTGERTGERTGEKTGDRAGDKTEEKAEEKVQDSVSKDPSEGDLPVPKVLPKDSPAEESEENLEMKVGGKVAEKVEGKVEQTEEKVEESDIEIGSGRPEGEVGDDYVADSSRYGGSRSQYGRRGRSFDDAAGYYSGSRRDSADNDTNFVFVDPHVLGSPVLVDIDNDGVVEVLVAVSYYFDKEEYAGKDLDFDPSMYVAGGLACWNLQSQDWTWLVHLDLTTDKTKFKAIIYSTPTVADLDGDGRSEIVLGTSMGLLYLLDGDNGFVKRFFPMQFHEIQAQVAVADVMGGSGLEIIVADMGGTLAVVDLQGEILWDANLSGTLPHTPTVGDVDGDGQMDIAVVAASADGTSHLWVVRGDTGEPLPGYPMSLPIGAIASASVLLVDLHDYRAEATLKTSKMSKDKVLDPSMTPWMGRKYGYEPRPSPVQLEVVSDNSTATEKKNTGYKRRMAAKNKNALNNVPDQGPKSKGLHIIVPSFDGHIYVIEGALQCAERIDIGEHIYSTPLMTDMTGDGNLDLVVGTLSGQVHMLESSVPHHPLNSWASFPNGRLNGFTHGVMGVSVPLESRTLLSRADFIAYNRTFPPKHSNGSEDLRLDLIIAKGLLAVTFDIWDSRKTADNRKYKVTMTKGTNKQSVLASLEYDAPGRYTVLVPVYPPEIFVLVIGMTNEHGQYFEDTVPLEVGTFFYVWMKYILLLPTLLMSVPLLLMRKKMTKS